MALSGQPTTVLQGIFNAPVDKPVEHVTQWKQRGPEWTEIRAVVDSGASESVAPPGMAPNFPMRESVGSRRGQHYVSASGNRIPNLGEQHLQVMTDDGVRRGVTFQVTEVTRPLCSVARMCALGNRVILGASGGEIVHLETGVRTPVRLDDGVYTLSMWLGNDSPVRTAALERGGPEGHEGEEVDEMIERGEQVHDVVSRRVPATPSVEEVRLHRLTHTPFRSWCPVCIAARGRDPPHRRRGPRDLSQPQVHLDYFFPRDGPGEDSITAVVMREEQTRAIAAHVVPRKGDVEWVVIQLHRDLLKWGVRGNLTMKCDQEESIKSLLDGLAKRRSEAEPSSRTIIEHSPVKDSSGNGIAEVSVRAVEEMTRCLKLGLEERIKKKISVQHKVFAWLVEHAADVLTKYALGDDGMSAYKRLKGKSYRGTLFEFGQHVMYRVSGKPQGSSMLPRWHHGIWLGKRFASDENIVSTRCGVVVRARGVRSVSQEQLFDSVLLDEVKGTPWNADGKGDEDVEVIRLSPLQVPEGVVMYEDPVHAPRAPRIRREHLTKFGYTATCQKCKAIMRDDRTQPTLGHSNE
eukprot:6473751-Amphidinium_carterae.1